MKLTPKQAKFIKEYLIDLNATQAVIRAGYSKNGAKTQGSLLLSNINVKAHLNKLQEKRALKTDLSMEWVVKRLMLLADATIDEFVDVSPNGVCLKDFKEIPNEKKYAVQEVSETIGAEGRGAQRVKLADKIRALEVLWKHLGGTERKEIEIVPYKIADTEFGPGKTYGMRTKIKGEK